MEGPIDRIVHSGDNEGESGLLRMPAQARNCVVLYRDGQHWHLNLEAFNRVDGPRSNLKSCEETPGVYQRGNEGRVCVGTFPESHTCRGLRGDGPCYQWSVTYRAADHCGDRLRTRKPRRCRLNPPERGGRYFHLDERGSGIRLPAVIRRTAMGLMPAT